MGRIKLAIIGETPYADRLAGYIRKNGPDYLEVSRCQKATGLAGFLTDLQPDILLSEQRVVMQERMGEGVVKILLTDSEGESRETQPAIFRFQHGAEILRQVFWIYGQSGQKDVSCWYKTGDLQMTAVYAPGGHELHLPFSVAYASLCGQKDNVLYLNFSEFSGMVSLFRDQEGESISDLIYGIRHKKEKFPFILQSALHHAESFDYVHPPLNPKDLYEIQEEDLMNLLSLLKEQTDYTHIVLHIGVLNQIVGQLLKHCHKVFCVVKESSFGKYRKAEYKRFLEKEAGKELQKKVQYVNPHAGNGGFLQGVDIMTQLQSGEFAEQVRALTQLME